MRAQTHYERSREFLAVDSRLQEAFDLTAQRVPLERVPFVLLESLEGLTSLQKARMFSWAAREIMRRLLTAQPDPYSYGLLCENATYDNLFRSMVHFAGSQRVIEPSVVTDYYMLSYERAGKRTYDVHPDLAERLRDTELRGLTANDLRLPYEAIYVVVPKSAGLKVWNNETGWHDVDGMYVVEEQHLRAKEQLGDPVGPYRRGWRVLVCGEPKGATEVFGAQIPDDAISYFSIHLPEGWTLEQSLDDARKSIADAVSLNLVNWDPENRIDWVAHFRWVMNVILYCTWEEPGEHWEENTEARKLWDRIQKLHKGEKRKELQQRLSKLQRQPRLRLGYQTKVRRGIERTTSATKAFELGGAEIRTRVAGHWKRQAHGPGLSERKLIWIEPYWRHPDGEVHEQAPVHAVS